MTEEKTFNGSDELKSDVQKISSSAVEEVTNNSNEPEQSAQDAAPIKTGLTEDARKIDAATKTSEELNSANKRIEQLEAQILMQKLNVKEDCIEDLFFLAKQRVNNETTMKQAIENIVNKYPDFVKEMPSMTPSVSISNNDYNNNTNDSFLKGFNGVVTDG